MDGLVAGLYEIVPALQKVANMNTIIDIYPDGDDDSAPGFMEEEG